ncbi:MAG: CpsD/CapB family tyrosine-protein kinase [Thermoflexales bacterium]|nr:CpsD/CapB family tyrosine-protein kinase [Thermoflexales bacterium]MCS7324158.1 CpsD/CapB family tyrosine-protein kinase [Thermoflexales bacterium]MCX7937822.1 CpsD/CapB family tyrosine-protein kinase [Thermoflexales bacterium]MDW8053235.1 CpsD/CapB family tyrosine-protein kinase [Anaerolineae bacterium]MDW8291886.1 CpsD/CapB family tyrosine-protein kinase [Anaerolineae bacterium]
MTLVMLTQPNSRAAEAYRALRANLALAALEQPLRVVLIAPADPATDAASVAGNLAIALANAEQRVIAVDADLRQPSLHLRFGVDGTRGLVEWLGALESAPPLCSTSVAGLHVLPAGTHTNVVAADVVASRRMAQALNTLRELADAVVVCAPPLSTYTDAAVLAPHADGVVLVVAAHRTRRTDAKRAQILLERAHVRLLGAVLLE